MIKPAGVKIYFQPTHREDSCGKIRIIQPDGQTHWMSSSFICCQDHTSCIGECCFAKEGMTQKQVIKAMREFDKESGFPPAELIGEL